MNALEILSMRLSAESGHFAFMDAFVAVECVQCIKGVLNSHAGVQYFVSSPDLVSQLAYGKRIYNANKICILLYRSDQITLNLVCNSNFRNCLRALNLWVSLN